MESAVVSNNYSVNNPLSKFAGKLADLIYGRNPFMEVFQEIWQSLQNSYFAIIEVHSEPSQTFKMKLYAK